MGGAMAHVMLLPKGMSQLPHIFVTDDAVGLGCANKRDDVLLVQFFLAGLSADLLTKGNQQFNYISKKGTPFNYTVPGQRPIGIDGVCGTQTVAYIKHFQVEASKTFDRSADFSMVADGKVTPIYKNNPWGQHTGRVLSIVRLNTEYSDMYGPDRLANIWTEPMFPRELVPSFYMSF